MPTPIFSKTLLDFFRELEQNNNRTWFQANKARFETVVRDPLLAFIEAFRPRLRRLAPHLVADAGPSGGSLFRIYRDTRFSRDKSPYKTYLGVQFRHERARDVHAPGLYLHVQPRHLFIGAGLWRPDRTDLNLIRQHIALHPRRWTRALGDEAFRARFDLAGETLKRPPRGYESDHPLIEDLKRKDFIATAPLTEREFLARGFLDRFTEAAMTTRPFLRFLTRAVNLAW